MPVQPNLAADVQLNWPSGWTLVALAPLVLLVLGLITFCLIDLIRAPSVKYLPKPVWALIIVLFSAPLGGILYLAVGRNRAGDGAQHEADADDVGRRQSLVDNDGAIPPRHPTNSDPSPSPTPTAQAQPTPPAQTSTIASAGVDTALAGERGLADPGSQGANTTSNSAKPNTTTFERATPGTAPSGSDPVIETVGLTRDFGGVGLFDVDLSVPRGSVYGLVGPNGAGKTTLLSILTGMRRADRGSIRMALPRSAIAVCPDVPEFDGWLTAWEVVDLARALIGASAATDPTTRALQAAGLSTDADRRVGGFSRGMTQRLGLACALVGDPQLLIFDEPTSALDPAGRSEVLDLLSGMRGTRTVLMSSHILADVQRVADQVGVLRDGRLLYQGPTQALIDTHLQPRWLVRVGGEATGLRDDLAGQPWVTRVDRIGPNAVRVEAITLEAGERGIPAVLAASGERLVSCEPVAADLEAAFLALTAPGATRVEARI